MKDIPSGSIDLIFADPPYYLQLPKNNHKLKRPDGSFVQGCTEERDAFDSYESYDIFTNNRLVECQRIMKDTGTIRITGMYHNIFRVGAIMQNLGFWFLNDVIWIKNDALPNLNGRRMTNNHETILWAVKNKHCKNYTYNNILMKKINGGKELKDTDRVFNLCKGVERIKDENGIKAHPTQKPVKLLQHIIISSSKAGDTVLDPFFGTGTTGFVAQALNRKRIGIEKSEKYVEIAKKRLGLK